jgi:hypothetical protein
LAAIAASTSLASVLRWSASRVNSIRFCGSGEVSDQCAFRCVGSQFLQMRFHVLHARPFALLQLLRTDANDIEGLPLFIGDLQAPLLLWPKLSVDVLEHLAGHQGGFAPSRFVIAQFLALVINKGGPIRRC